jgi:type II secretory pathway component PulF
MAYFVIKFIGQEGNIVEKPVQAISKEEALSKSGLNERNVESVDLDHLGALRAALTEKRLPTSEQILALVTMASMLETGRTPGRAIGDAVDLKKLDLNQADLAHCEKPSDYFKLLRFDEIAVLLAEAGDKSGYLAESLKRAAEVMRDRMKTKKEFAKPMRKAAINFVVGVLAGIGFPLFGGKMLYEFIIKQKLPITLNPLSHIMMWLNDFYLNFWPMIVGVLIAGFIFRARIWESARTWPLINLLNNRLRCQRGLEFIQTYHLLTSNGFTNPMVLQFLHDRTKGRVRDLYKEALERNVERREIGQVFEGDEWPKIISQNMKGFEHQTLEGRERILQNLSEALTGMYIHYSEKIADTVSVGAMLVLISSIMLFGIGFYVPMVTMRMTM